MPGHIDVSAGSVVAVTGAVAAVLMVEMDVPWPLKNLPWVLVLLAALVVGYSLLTNRGVFGRHIYAVGGNLQAATLSGRRASARGPRRGRARRGTGQRPHAVPERARRAPFPRTVLRPRERYRSRIVLRLGLVAGR